MIARAGFLKAVGAVSVATGGLDVWASDAPQIRVLVANDVRGELPQVAFDGTFAFGGKRWRGAPSTVGMPDGRMALVTTIDVDGYLQGVVPLESPASWPPAALQAQAIVARTFALGRRSAARAYDVLAAESDQRWGGVEAERPPTNAAVQATRGRTLLFAGAPAAAYYSACCGGHTADVASMWAGIPLAYLRGVDDRYCSAAPDFRWTRIVPVERVTGLYAGRLGGPLVAAELRDPDGSGRPRTVVLTGVNRIELAVAELRRTLGTEVVRSLWLRSLRLETGPDGVRLVIEGCGRGHGVGLCQWGARGMAATGASTSEIIAHYFPGTTLS